MRPTVRRALDVIDLAFAELDGVEAVAAAVGVPVEALRRAFRDDLGVAPRETLERRRVEEAKRLLTETDLRVSEVARAVGWPRDDTASRAFQRTVGTTMTEFRRSAARE